MHDCYARKLVKTWRKTQRVHTGQARLRKSTFFEYAVFPPDGLLRLLPPNFRCRSEKPCVVVLIWYRARHRVFARVGTKGHSCSENLFSYVLLRPNDCLGCSRARVVMFRACCAVVLWPFSHTACSLLQVQITDKEGLTIRLISLLRVIFRLFRLPLFCRIISLSLHSFWYELYICIFSCDFCFIIMHDKRVPEAAEHLHLDYMSFSVSLRPTDCSKTLLRMLWLHTFSHL